MKTGFTILELTLLRKHYLKRLNDFNVEDYMLTHSDFEEKKKIIRRIDQIDFSIDKLFDESK